MPLVLTSADIVAITSALSASRLSSYAPPTSLSDPTASAQYPLELYRWNAAISGAFLTPLEIYIVVFRNAIAEAIEAKYGANWPWVSSFERALPNSVTGYSPKQDLLSVRSKFKSTGKVIPELKLIFWSQMLTSRYDERLWKPFMLHIFPNIPASQNIDKARATMYRDMEQLRRFRNRIAHHEPIFKLPLAQNLTTITALVAKRCEHAAAWLNDIETVTPLIKSKFFKIHPTTTPA